MQIGSTKLDRNLGEGKPSTVTIAVSGSLILVYTLWAGMVLTKGASGQWSVMHPSLFAFISVTIGTYVGLVAEQREMPAKQHRWTLSLAR